ncbi:MAG: 5-formyltetrahydrofolate cyclo-ligase [Thiobacillaceae bacterium]
MNKSTLRRHLKALRSDIKPDARSKAALRALRLALRHGLFLRPRRIGFYLPHGAEFDVRPLLNQALWMKRVCCLPVISGRDRVLRFARLNGQNKMTANRYGILEPSDSHPFRAQQLDILFMPLLGFDCQGHRLGMGGGYYDATLAYLARRRIWKKPLLIGVGYECQRVDTLPHDPWDAPLDAVLTERGFHAFKR